MFVDFNILNQLGSPSINSNTFANRPAAGQTGRLFVSTDTFEIYRDNGTTWDLIGGPGSSTITGTGTATQVAYFTSSQAIGSSANLFWDNTSGFLGVATATPSARIEAVKTDGVGIYANYTTNAGSGSSTTAIWAKNITNSSGFAAVIEETTPNTTAGQYPLLIKHSLSSGTAGVGMGTGIHWQLPDDAGTFKTTQLTIETIDAAAATYATRYRFNVQSNGTGTPVAYINATGLGIFTATPGAALDIHSTGIMAQLNSTSATANSLLAFQRSGSGLWRIGDVYNGGPNYFELYNTVLGINAMQVFAATNKTSWQATENYTSGVARGNYFDYNLTLNPANPLASPNAISAVGASLDLTLEGSITIPSGARSGLDAYNSIRFTTTGTLTHNQGTQIRAYSNLTAGWAFNGSATGTITHLAGLRALFPDNTGSAVTVTNNYALLLNDQTANTGTVTYTNRWGIYQEGSSDLNYFAANLLLGSTVNNGNTLQVTGNANITSGLTVNTATVTTSLTVGVTPTYSQLSVGNATATIRLGTFFRGIQGFDATLPTNYGNPYLSIGGQENNLNSIQSIAFGFSNGSYIQPGEIGFQTTSLSGYTLGDLVFATRGVTTNTAPTERMRLNSAGNLGLGTSTPTTYSLTGTHLDIAGGGNYAFLHTTTTSVRAFFAARESQADARLFTNTNHLLAFGTNDTERARFTAGGNFLIGTTTDNGRKLQVNGNITAATIEQSQTSATAINTLAGNSNAQGAAHNYTIVRAYPVVSLGTKLIIPFVSQGSLNSTTICKIYGHSAIFNNPNPLGFEITFAVGHLTTLSNLNSWGGNGNYASIAINGMDIEITFTSAYTSATSNGIYATIQYMTNVPSYSIIEANIAMN